MKHRPVPLRLSRHPRGLTRAACGRLPGALHWVCLVAVLLAVGATVGWAREVEGAPGDLDVRRDAVVDAVEKVMPSVVNIAIEGSEGDGGGSGVVVDEDGYVLTNAHVVRNANRIWVKFNDGTEEIRAERLELTRAKDVALLRLKAKPGQKFKAIKFAKDDDLLLGETVIALGNPFGLGGSVSRGILSSKNRRRPEQVGAGEFLDIPDWLQTDAAINPGNSGGPLINLNGEMIGLSVAILSPQAGAQGIGFAIPIKHVSIALAEILTGDSLRGFWFGARLKAAQGPLTVQAVQPGSPAEKAGLRAEDVILQVNRQKPDSLIEFNRILTAAGDKADVRLLVARGGQQRELLLRMIQEKDFFNAELLRRRLGLTVEALPERAAYRMGLIGALVIQGVEAGGPAAASGLGAGMLVVNVDREPVRTVLDAAKLVHSRRRGEGVSLGVVVTEQRGIFQRRYVAEAEVKTR